MQISDQPARVHADVLIREYSPAGGLAESEVTIALVNWRKA